MLWNRLKQRMLTHPASYLCEGERIVTYEESAAYAERFAENLTAPCYGILCETELGTALAVLSCLAAGKTAVPLSRRYGEVHLRRILNWLQPRFLIGEKAGELTLFEIEDEHYEVPEPSPAFILCTSGTTGEPKGVMLSEENILANAEDILRYFPLTEKDRILISRPIYHCAVLTGEFLVSLMRGTNLYFFENPYSVGEFVKEMERRRITVVCSTPSYFQLVSRLAKRALPAKTVAVSGECLAGEAAQRIRLLFPQADIYHVYGLTEASPRVAYLVPERFDRAPQTLSHPLHSVSMKITGENGAEVLDGREGELWIKGKNVMLGYYKAPGLTADTVRDGWLRTGDMAVRFEDGSIRILGRKDDMIVYAGMNLYPGEIESALKEDPRVEEVLAYAIPHPLAGQAVALKVKGSFLDPNEVSALCRRVLPMYEQPAKIELTDEIPKNATGKIVRRK